MGGAPTLFSAALGRCDAGLCPQRLHQVDHAAKPSLDLLKVWPRAMGEYIMVHLLLQWFAVLWAEQFILSLSTRAMFNFSCWLVFCQNLD